VNGPIRSAAHAVLPQAIVDRIRLLQRRRRGPGVAFDDPVELGLERVELIRRAPLAALTDAGYLERELLPALGLNDESPELFPENLSPHSGQGLRSWQYPVQFSRYLVLLSRYDIRSYVEIGVRHGGTFVLTCEYLSRFGRLERALAVDLLRARSIDEYADSLAPSPLKVTQVQCDTSRRACRRELRSHGTFDLAFIDGDHSFAGCWSDFTALRGRAGIIALHDIVSDASPDVPRVWQRIRREYGDRYELHEFDEQYRAVSERTGERYLGIGVAIDRRLARTRSP
jgi:Methyltransferase domain